MGRPSSRFVTFGLLCGLTIFVVFSVKDVSAKSEPCSVKKYEEACDSICGEQDTCVRVQYSGHYCHCTQNNPETISNQDDNYDCEEIDLDEKDKRSIGDTEPEPTKEELEQAEDDRAERSLEKKQKMKQCAKYCDKAEGNLSPYTCKRTEDGKKAKLPKHMCACSDA